MTQPGQPLYGLETTNNGRVVTFAGGSPRDRNLERFSISARIAMGPAWCDPL